MPRALFYSIVKGLAVLPGLLPLSVGKRMGKGLNDAPEEYFIGTRVKCLRENEKSDL